MMALIPESRWHWYGMAGHLIVGSQCLHHLCTKVGKHLVSTVGDYRPRTIGDQIGRREQIGCDRDFETMVFKIIGGECQCGCGLPTIDTSEIDFLPANDHKTAEKNHIKLCKKYSRLTGDQR